MFIKVTPIFQIRVKTSDIPAIYAKKRKNTITLFGGLF